MSTIGVIAMREPGVRIDFPVGLISTVLGGTRAVMSDRRRDVRLPTTQEPTRILKPLPGSLKSRGGRHALEGSRPSTHWSPYLGIRRLGFTLGRRAVASPSLICAMGQHHEPTPTQRDGDRLLADRDFLRGRRDLLPVRRARGGVGPGPTSHRRTSSGRRGASPAPAAPLATMCLGAVHGLALIVSFLDSHHMSRRGVLRRPSNSPRQRLLQTKRDRADYGGQTRGPGRSELPARQLLHGPPAGFAGTR